MDVRAYHLSLDIDHISGRFRGEVRIDLTHSDPPLELDSTDLEIEGVEVDGVPAGFRDDRVRSRLILEPLNAPAREVRVRFAGVAREGSLFGPYLSRFGTGHLWTTLLFPAGCQRVFPCLDAPAHKAVFHVTITADLGLRVISNAAVEKTEDVSGRRRWVFFPTPRMSTYLLYIGVGAFEEIESDSDAFRVVVATAPGHSEAGRRALGRATAIIRGFEEYYRIPYPLPKLHLVAVPDFWAGGMENWGAISFAESCLLVDHTTTPSFRRYASEVLAHEIAHQWFGNLVTMAWWDDFWLNESFATFAALQMADRLHLEDDLWHDHFLIGFDAAYLEDSLLTTHPIEVPIERPEEVTQIVDQVSYGKGAAVLRMMERFVGESGFRDGLATYLKRHAYGNARGEDLWAALEETCRQPVRRIMADWVRRAGHPVISVSRYAGGLELEQRLFRLGPPVPEPGPWPIPLTYEVDGATHRILFDERRRRIEIPAGSRFRLNPDREGFFRIAYAPVLLDEVLAAAPGSSPTDRWALLNDASAFLLAGELDLDAYMAILERFGDASDLLTRVEITEGLYLLHGIFPESPPLLDRVHRLLEHLCEGADASPPDALTAVEALARERLLWARADLDLEFARRLARRWAEVDTLDPALRAAVVLSVGRAGGPGVVGRLTERLHSSGLEQLMIEAAWALGSLRAPDELHEALALVWHPRTRLAHGAMIVRSASANPAGRAVAWEWIRSNLPELAHRAEGTPEAGQLLLLSIPWLGLGRVEEVREFFRAEPFPESKRQIAKGLALLDVYEALRTRGFAR